MIRMASSLFVRKILGSRKYEDRIDILNFISNYEYQRIWDILNKFYFIISRFPFQVKCHKLFLVKFDSVVKEKNAYVKPKTHTHLFLFTSNYYWNEINNRVVRITKISVDCVVSI